MQTWVEGRSTPGLDQVLQFAQALNISLRWLLTGHGLKQPFEGVEKVSGVSHDEASPAPPDDDPDSDRWIREVESFRALLEDAVRRRDKRLLGWLSIEIGVWRKQVEARFPEIAHAHSLSSDGEV